MKIDLFMLARKALSCPHSCLDNEIEIVIRKDLFEKKGFKEFKIKFIELGVKE